MGIFDKLKQAANFVTGGGAKLTVEAITQPLLRNQPMRFKVTCHIESAEMPVNNVYLQIRAVEYIELLDYDMQIDGHSRRERIYRQTETYTNQVIIAPSQTLAANSNQQWDVEVNLPENVFGTYHGRFARHTWQVLAALDKSGNDPDSGWVEIFVS